MRLFLQPKEVAELTGCNGGCPGKTREERQILALRKMKIPHYVNIANRPIVARSVINVGKAPEAAPTWSPSLG